MYLKQFLKFLCNYICQGISASLFKILSSIKVIKYFKSRLLSVILLLLLALRALCHHSESVLLYEKLSPVLAKRA